ncbi:hypothetical protein [Streptomyces sp. B21-102]|uniref:hypothetical protein n=1 Tax=Streptomyces sp. B21-102 TaxID=3039416 RepID=UPI002FF43B95
MRETATAEGRNIDDQALWADGATLVYALPGDYGSDLWTVPRRRHRQSPSSDELRGPPPPIWGDARRARRPGPGAGGGPAGGGRSRR